MSDTPRFTESSGNVFADIGLPDADVLLLKADLVRQISSIIEHRHLTQAQAGEILGIDQPKVSLLLRGHLDRFSMERLYRFLNALGRDVQIVVTPKPRSRAKGETKVVSRPRSRSSRKATG